MLGTRTSSERWCSNHPGNPVLLSIYDRVLSFGHFRAPCAAVPLRKSPTEYSTTLTTCAPTSRPPSTASHDTSPLSNHHDVSDRLWHGFLISSVSLLQSSSPSSQSVLRTMESISRVIGDTVDQISALTNRHGEPRIQRPREHRARRTR